MAESSPKRKQRMNTPSTEAQSGKGRIPNGTKRIVIFDTNAYRDFAPGGTLPDSAHKAVRLRQCEQESSVCALASPTVVWELTAHLADPADRYYNQCLKSLVVLGEHAVDASKPEGGINLFSDSESTVCRQLFHVVPTQNEKGVRNLGSLVKHIVKYAPDLSDPIAEQNIKKIASLVDATERQWLTLMEEVLSRCEPKAVKQFFGDLPDDELRKQMREFYGSSTFVYMWAKFMVEIHAAKVGRSISSVHELNDKIKIILEVFPVPFHLMSMLLQKSAMDKNFKLSNPKKKRWNFIWDSQLTFSIGADHNIAGVPIFFVTSDHEVLGAAKAAKCDTRVLPLTEYLASVGFRHI